MKNKPILIIILILGLLAVCALCALTSYSTYAWLNRQPGGIRLWNSANISAQVQETRSFEVTGPVDLQVYSEAGKITVTAAEVDTVQVEFTRTAWAASQEEAQAAAEALPVTFNQTGDQLAIRYERQPVVTIGGSSGMDTVDFVIRVPVETAVKLETSFGEVSVTGTTGDADLTSSFGSLYAVDITGALSMHSSQADLTVENVDAGTDPVTLDTSFGKININGLAGGEMTIRTTNGAIKVNDLTASGSVEIDDSFGDVSLRQVTASSLRITSSNGRVEVRDCTAENDLEVTNTFGDVTLRGTSALAYDIETSNGTLDLEGVSGELTLTNSFGDILVSQADTAALTLKTSNGRISFSGTLDPAATHSLENSFGDIDLTIPADSAFDVYLETQFGEIHTDLPITLSGALSQTTLEGTLNGGGPLLRAMTSNGNITLSALPAGR
jgi:DUF4097 and DUF4098 domain-containing protein YvlB